MTMLRQSMPVMDIKALTDDGRIEGYASVFGVVDRGEDAVMPGAFAKSLSELEASGGKVRMLWQHDPSRPIGRWTELVEDERGLKATGAFNMEVAQGREARALLKAGDIDGLSIGYSVVRAKRDEETGVRELHEVKLWEVSLVTFPMNEMAVAQAKAQRDADELRDRLAAGDRLTEREMEQLLKGALGLSNSQAERAVRLHLKGSGEPAVADERAAFLRALSA